MIRRFKTNSRIVSEHFANYSDTFRAFCELINNSIQAKATEIDISITQSTAKEVTDLPIKEIHIRDDGHGVSESDFDKKILELGTEVKEGGMGIGRFSCFQLGNKVEIETVGYNKTADTFTKVYCCLDSSYLKSKSFSEAEIKTIEENLSGHHKTYYSVKISEFHPSYVIEKNRRNKISKNLLLDSIAESLFQSYPIQIFNNEINFTVNGSKIDPKDFVIGQPEKISKTFINKKGKPISVQFSYFNIRNSNSDIKVFLMVDNAGIQTVAGSLDFRADWLSPNIGSWYVYVSSSEFHSDTFRNIDVPKLDEDIKEVKTFIKDSLINFFSIKNKEFEDFKSRLKEDSHYPYRLKEASSNTKSAFFDKIAYFIEDKYHILKEDNKLRELIYPLIDKSLSNGKLDSILTDIIKLDDRTLEKFHSVMQKTSLESVIEFSDNVASKNQFLDLLYNLTYGDVSAVLRERSELHKIIEKNLWIFGENYAQTPYLSIYSDKNLANNLDRLREDCLNYEPAIQDENLNTDSPASKDITDLFFYNEKTLDSGKREIMVVELKAPKWKINQKELNQIDRYAFQIKQKPEFSSNLHYKLILISSNVSDFALAQCGQIDQSDRFLYKRIADKNIEVYVIKWADIIEMNRNKLSYLGSVLRTKDISTIEYIEKDFEEINIDNLKSRLSKARN